MFGATDSVNIAKKHFSKTNFLACFLAEKDTPLAATLQDLHVLSATLI